MTFDAVIAGAGPAGLACSLRLAQSGLRVCVLERKPAIGYPVCCGEAISKKSLETSGFFDTSYIASEVSGYRIFFPDNNFMSVESDGYILNRGKFEKYLAKKAMDAGAQLMLRTAVFSCSQSGASVTIRTTTGEIKSKYLIAADGPDSLCASFFSDEKNTCISAMQYRILKPADIKPCGKMLDFYYDSLAPMYFWNFEKNKYFNAGGCVNDKQTLKSFISKRLTDKEYDTEDFTRGRIPVSCLKKKIVFGNVALIGDAAGAVNAVSFAGIYGALRTASECADAIIKNDLQKYEDTMKKSNLAARRTKYLARHCYSFPEKVLLFLGEYFTGRTFRTKDVPRFMKLVIKYPVVLKHIVPLLLHRQVLKEETHDMW